MLANGRIRQSLTALVRHYPHGKTGQNAKEQKCMKEILSHSLSKLDKPWDIESKN